MPTLTPALSELLHKVVEERKRQDVKWGRSFLGRGDAEWLTILTEEVGEVARSIIEGDEENLIIEITQCAAVCLKWLELRNNVRAD